MKSGSLNFTPIYFLLSSLSALYFSISDPVYYAPAWSLVVFAVVIGINVKNLYVPFTFFAVFTIFYLAWIKDVDPSLLRTNTEAWVDSQKYSASAVKYIETGYGYGHWLGKGIEYYLTSIYYIFGINEINVITFNVVLIVIGIKFLKNINLPASPGVILLFCPLLLYYAAQPSKEIITFPLVAIILNLYMRLSHEMNWHKLILLILIFLLFSYFRLSAAMLIFVCLSLTYFITNPSLVNLLALCSLFPISFVIIKYLATKFLGANFDFWAYIINFSDANSRLISYMDNKGISSSASASKIKLILSPENQFISAVLIPIKAVLVLISPFPSLPNFLIPVNASQAEVSLYVYKLLAFKSGFLNFLAIIWTAINYQSILAKVKKNQNLKIIFFFLIFYFLIVAFAYPTAFTRHRVVAEPIFWLFILSTLPRVKLTTILFIIWSYLLIFIISFEK